MKTSEEYQALSRGCAACSAALACIIEKLSKFDARNDSQTANTVYFTVNEINKEIQGMSSLLENVYLDMYEKYGMLTKEVSERGIAMFRAKVVYYEIFHEILMLHNSTFAINVEYPYQYGKNKEKEIDGIAQYGVDQYLTAKQSLVKDILKNRAYLKIDFSLPSF